MKNCRHQTGWKHCAREIEAVISLGIWRACRRFIGLLLGLLLGLPLTGWATTYYVATNGLDTYPGSLSQPFLTISNAASLAVAGDTVEIRGGIYRETVVPANNGASNAPITFEAYSNEVVTVSGADVIPAGSWQLCSNSIYQSPMTWDLGFSNQVFVDGLMMNEARYPNNDYDQTLPNSLTISGASCTAYVNGQPQYAMVTNTLLNRALNFWVGAIFHVSGGSGSTYGMAESDPVIASSSNWITLNLTLPSSSANYLPSVGMTFYLTGLFSLLDSPGEWFLDSTNNLLYLMSPFKDSPANHLVEAKSRFYGFDLSGCSYVKLNRISLFACTVNTDNQSHDNLLNGLEVAYPSFFGWITDHYKSGAYDSGIILKGSNNIVQNSSIAYSAGNGISLLGSGNKALTNFIHDVAQQGSDCAGVATGSFATSGTVPNGEIGQNTVFNASRALLQIRALYAGSVHHNQLWNGVCRTTDYGAIYTDSPDGGDTRIAYNRIHGMRPPCNVNNAANGIYLDNGIGHYVVDHNVVWGAYAALLPNAAYGGGFHYLQVYNNTFIGDNVSMGYSLYPDAPHSTFQNNICYQWASTLFYQDTNNAWVPYTNATLVQDHNIFRREKGQNPSFYNLTNFDFRAGSSLVLNQGVAITLANGTSITPPGDATPDLGAYNSNTVWTAGAIGISSGQIGARWQYGDIGGDPTLSPPGHSALIGNSFLVSGGGADIGGTNDAFHFLSQPITGDATGLVELTFQDNSVNAEAWSKAGIMLRDNLSPNSSFVMLGGTPGNGVILMARDGSNTVATLTNLAGIVAPVWLKLNRSGNSFTGSYRTNTGAWLTLGTLTANLGATVQAGLAVTSRTNQSLSTAIFQGLQLLTTHTPYFTNLSSGLSQNYGATNAVSLSGQLVAPGPVYPAMGESVSVSINGINATTTITNATGGFGLSLNLGYAPAGVYPIVYAYPGSASLNPATDSSKTARILTVPLTVIARNLTCVSQAGYAFQGNEFMTAGLLNGDQVTTASLSCTGATAGSALGLYPIIPASAQGVGLSNYSLTYSNGLMTVINSRNLRWTINSNGITDGSGIWNEGTPCQPNAAWFDGSSYGNLSYPGDRVQFGGGTAGTFGAITNGGLGVNPASLTISRPWGGGNFAFYGAPIQMTGGNVTVVSNNPSFYCQLNGSFTLVGSNQTAYLMTNNAQVASDWITINPGMTLQCGGNGGYGNAGGATLTNNGNLIWRRSGSQVVSNTIFGAGNVTYQLRSANFTFAAPQAYTGDTVLQPTGVNALGSTVKLDATDRLPVTTDLILNSFSNAAITLDLNGNDQTVASLASDAASTLTSTMITNSSGNNGSTLTLAGTNRQTFYNGQMAGNLGLTLNGTNSRFTLSNDCNYAGITLINTGCLALGAGASISNTPLIGVGGGATFDVSGVGGSYSLCAGQILTNAGATTGIVNGSLNLAAGALNLSYLAGTPSFLITNGTLTLSANTMVLVDNQGAALAVGSYKIVAATASGAVAGSLPLVNVTGNGLNGVGASLQVVNNELYLTVIPSRNLRWTVGTNGITDGGGIWNEGAPCQPNAAWFDGSSYGNISFPGDSVQFGGGTAGVFGSITNGGISVNPTNLTIYRPWGGGNYAFYGAPIQMTGGKVSVVSNNPSFYCQLNGSFTLVGSNQTAYLIANGAQLASDTITINPGMTLQCGGNSGTGSPGAATLTNNGSLIWRRSGTQIVSNAITGSGNVIYQLRSASFTFAAAQTYTGDTTIQPTGVNAGSSTVTLDVDDRLPTITDLVMKSFAGATNTLDLNGNNQMLASLSSDAAATVASTIITNSAGTNGSTLTLSGTNRVTYFNGLLTGNLGLTLNGAGSTLTLSNDCSFTGPTLINAGCLALGLGASITNTPLISIGNGAFWDLSGVGGSYGLTSGQILSNAAAATGMINGSLNAGSAVINVTYNIGAPALLITNGTFTLGSGTGFKIFNQGLTLPAGSYKIIAATANGMVAGSVPSVTVLGNGYSGLGATLQFTNNELYLVVAGSLPSPVTLTVTSLQGAPVPAGVTTNAYGTLINAYAPTTVNSTTQYVATGWTGTGSVGSGTGTNVSFNLTTNTTLIWRWQTNVWVNLNTLGN